MAQNAHSHRKLKIAGVVALVLVIALLGFAGNFLFDFALNPQAALDAPRWQWTKDKTVEVEHLFPESLAEALTRKGHNITRPVGNLAMGRGQIIWRDEHGVLAGGTEPRTDGAVAAW